MHIRPEYALRIIFPSETKATKVDKVLFVLRSFFSVIVCVSLFLLLCFLWGWSMKDASPGERGFYQGLSQGVSQGMVTSSIRR